MTETVLTETIPTDQDTTLTEITLTEITLTDQDTIIPATEIILTDRDLTMTEMVRTEEDSQTMAVVVRIVADFPEMEQTCNDDLGWDGKRKPCILREYVDD